MFQDLFKFIDITKLKFIKVLLSIYHIIKISFYVIGFVDRYIFYTITFKNLLSIVKNIISIHTKYL